MKQENLLDLEEDKLEKVKYNTNLLDLFGCEDFVIKTAVKRGSSKLSKGDIVSEDSSDSNAT